MDTIRVRVYDVALFLKENAEEIIQEYTGPELAFVHKWNKIVKQISTYGYFFDGESEEDGFCERYWKPSTSVSIRAVKILFDLNKSDNVFLLPRILLGTWIYDFLVGYKFNPINSIPKRRWRTIGKAKASLFPRYL